MVELKKIQTMMVGIMFLLLGIATSCSDGDEAILPEQASAKMPATEVVVNKDSCMQLFSQNLVKSSFSETRCQNVPQGTSLEEV